MTAADPHPGTAGVAGQGAEDLRAALAAGTTTSVEVVTALLERIEVVDSPGTGPGLLAVLALAADSADRAAAADAARGQGRDLGPLHGVPVLVKDNVEAVGLPATAGSLALAGRPVAADAPLVARLRAAGAIVLGSTNLSEWANIRSSRSTSGWSAVGGLTGNPWALDRSAGGSSSGSGAAVAAGLAPLAVGTETDGSITCPASLNGCVGIKPGVGLVPTQGVVPVSGSQDAPGPLARSVRDAALLLEVLAGRSGYLAAAGRPPDGVRVGVVRGWLTGHPQTDTVFEAALRALERSGLAAVDVEAPAADEEVGADEVTVLLSDLVDDLGVYLAARPGEGVRTLADVVAFNRARADVELAHFGQELFEQALAGGGRRRPEYVLARRRNQSWALDRCLRPALAHGGGVDLLVAPAYAPAWKSDLALGDNHAAAGGAVTSPAAIAGWPILTVPMGLVDGLPVGLSFVGPPDGEALLVSVGHAFEQQLGLAADGGLTPAWRTAGRG